MNDSQVTRTVMFTEARLEHVDAENYEHFCLSTLASLQRFHMRVM